MTLDESTILDAARGLLDDRGLDGFTLRELATRLDVSQMAVYERFETRAAVIDLLADDLLAQLRWDEPELVTDPDERILGHALRAREVLLDHPDLVPVIAARPLVRPTRVDDLVRLHATFAEAGFPDERIIPSILSLLAVTVGLVLFEQQRMTVDREGPSYGSERDALRAQVGSRPEIAPSVPGLLDHFADGDWGTSVFEPCVRDCYRGLKARAGLPVD